jgi:hypothetical protein
LGAFFLVLTLERRSAARLREFYADATATIAVGPAARVFSAATSDESFLRRFWSRFLGLHPRPATRAAAMADHSTVYRADMMLFVLQGFFSAFILELVLQLQFTSASATLATFDDRRASLWRFLTINPAITSGTIILGALLVMTVHVLVLTRLAATISVAVEQQQRLRLIAAVPLFTAAGVLILLITGQSILWDLQQTGWDFPGYIIVGWDRLTLHSVALLALCTVIMVIFALKHRSQGSILALGALPALITQLVGYLLYRSALGMTSASHVLHAMKPRSRKSRSLESCMSRSRCGDSRSGSATRLVASATGITYRPLADRTDFAPATTAPKRDEHARSLLKMQ